MPISDIISVPGDAVDLATRPERRAGRAAGVASTVGFSAIWALEMLSPAAVTTRVFEQRMSTTETSSKDGTDMQA
jgi:hypothetical protein